MGSFLGPIEVLDTLDIEKTTMLLSKILRAADHPYLQGKGGRLPNNDLRLMQGLSIKSLKHHVALQPLMAIMAVGMTFVAFYCGRLASKTTDVNWTKAKDLGGHMGYYKARQFQWFNPSGKDYDKIAADRVARGEPVNYRE